MTHGMGYIPDLPDRRDHILSLPIREALPPIVDLRAQCPLVYDQGALGSCTGNAIAGALEFERKKQSLPDFTPSRLFIYYNERVMEHTVNSDSGAQIRDGIKSVAKIGACSETDWPYDISQFEVKPPAQCYLSAKLDRAISYQRVQRNLDQMKACLAGGNVFVAGFTVYESFESATVASTGIIPMPGANESVLGGHAICICGYDDSKQWFVLRNSWGDSWADKGYAYMPYAYLMNRQLSSDFWTIQSVGK